MAGVARTLLACASAAVLLLVASSASAATKAQELYDQYEKLNTPENLALFFVGGRPPVFVEQQIKLLEELGRQTSGDVNDLVVRVADEYLKRLDALGAEKFRTSPLQALQVPILEFLAGHAQVESVFQRVELFAKSPVTKEYAHARALGIVARKNVAKVNAKDDPDGRQRGRILLDTMIDDISFSLLLHAPVRIREFLAIASSALGIEPLPLRAALSPAAATLPRRYAVDYVSASFLARKQLRDKKPLSDEEKKMMMDVCGQWLDAYRPPAKQEKYASDVLGNLLLILGGWKDNKDLANLLLKNGLKPTPYVEPPGQPGPDQRKPPRPALE